MKTKVATPLQLGNGMGWQNMELDETTKTLQVKRNLSKLNEMQNKTTA